ncbi:hypothetical protein ACU4GD_16535 [Cupriavidus basilensis]
MIRHHGRDLRRIGRTDQPASTRSAHAVSQMDEVTQQNASLVEEAAAAAQSLEEQASRLKDTVAVFGLGNQAVASAASRAPAPRRHARAEGRHCLAAGRCAACKRCGCGGGFLIGFGLVVLLKPMHARPRQCLASTHALRGRPAFAASQPRNVRGYLNARPDQSGGLDSRRPQAASADPFEHWQPCAAPASRQARISRSSWSGVWMSKCCT